MKPEGNRGGTYERGIKDNVEEKSESEEILADTKKKQRR